MMGGGNMQQLARQAQKLQQQMTKMQEELEAREFEGSAGGMVQVKANGKKELTQILIKPEAVDPEDVEMLQDMVLAAVNQVMRLVEETSEAEMAKLTGGRGFGF